MVSVSVATVVSIVVVCGLLLLRLGFVVACVVLMMLFVLLLALLVLWRALSRPHREEPLEMQSCTHAAFGTDIWCRTRGRIGLTCSDACPPCSLLGFHSCTSIQVQLQVLPLRHPRAPALQDSTTPAVALAFTPALLFKSNYKCYLYGIPTLQHPKTPTLQR